MADYPFAEFIGTSHYWAGDNNPRYVIVHGTASGLSQAPQDVAVYFQSNNPPTSTHYVVGTDGTVVQCVYERDAAWGNGVITNGHDPWWTGNPNKYTISIEHIQNVSNTAELTPQQKASSFALIADICNRHNIPRQAADPTGGITGHYSIDPVFRTHCPGNYPWNELWVALGSNSKGTPGTANHVVGGGAWQGAAQVAASLLAHVTTGTVPGSTAAGSAMATVTTLPGFAPLAQGLDDAERFYALDGGGPVRLAYSIAKNLTAFFVRAIFVLLAVMIVIAIIFNVLRKMQPAIASAGELAALSAEGPAAVPLASAAQAAPTPPRPATTRGGVP